VGSQNAGARCLIALALSCAALFVNPVGIQQILYPVDTLLHMPLLVGNVAEYAPLQHD